MNALALTARARALTITVLLVLAASAFATWGSSPAAGALVTEDILTNPAFSGEPYLLGRRHIATSGSTSAIMYLDPSGTPWVYVRNGAGSTGSHIRLPAVPGADWSSTSYALGSAGQLWVMSGTGPVQFRRYQLQGAPLPMSATFVASSSIGDADSRPDDIIALASGGVVAVSHQQGNIGPQALAVSYLAPWTSTWDTIYPIAFMPTKASKFVVAQQPADGSIWIFGNPDSWGAIGALRLTEWSSRLQLDWTNPLFISSADGNFNADTENPDLEVTTDPASGSLILAYESIMRRIFSTAPVVTGSYVVLATIKADGTKSFVSLEQYVERVSSLGLVRTDGESWVAYRPIQADLAFTDLYLTGYSAGGWETPIRLGRLYSGYERVFSSPTGNEFAVRLDDGKVHLFGVSGGTASPTPSPSPTDSSTPSPTPTATPTPTAEPTAAPAPTATASPGPTPTATTDPSPAPTSNPVTRCRPVKKCR